MRLAATHASSAARTPSRPRLTDRLFAFVSSWLTQRAILEELHGLDDRTLADLRIYPGDFQAIAAGTYVREGGAHDFAPASRADMPSPRFRPYY
jgi:uncharacterized protein YjiS (DUF1127 family)